MRRDAWSLSLVVHLRTNARKYSSTFDRIKPRGFRLLYGDLERETDNGLLESTHQAGQYPNPATTPGSDKPDPASVTNVVDLSDPRLILDYSRPVRPLALPAEAVLKVIPLVSERVGASSWLKSN